ncbi:WW domain binding protein 11-domain-containing protein [Halenospora varia]|nr:WW domain binding protein 11-domain-containing protein [Halenospora varia]
MPKEKSVNPAQAQRKAEKAKAIKKGKAEQQSRRNEKLARRNPERLQKQLDELKAIETSGGKLTSHEKSVLEGLEKDIKAVKRAREALGDSAPKFSSGHGDRGDRDDRGGRGGFSGRGGRGGGVLGKRRRDDEGGSSEEEEVPDDVKAIPMPRDTPPPIPKEILDKWYQKRRERMGITQGGRGTNANNTPLGDNSRLGDRSQGQAMEKPPVLEAKTVYEAKPIVRDLRKEAVSFVPAAVRAKLDKSKGVGGLVEPEEADILEKAGYMGTVRKPSTDQEAASSERQPTSRAVMMEEVEDEDG